MAFVVVAGQRRTISPAATVSTMCGRYSIAVPGQAIVAELDCDGASEEFEWSPVFSVAPHTRAPIVRDRLADGERVREAHLSTWGLHPSWAKEKGPRPINARLETAATNGMFRSAFSSARALVPMTAYYEWQDELEDGKKVKNPSYIHGDGLLAAAGLVAAHHDDERDEWTTTFTIITRTGEDAAGLVHDRMPVLLSPAGWDRWLDPEKVTDKEAMIDMLDTESKAAASTLRTYPVSRAVNNVRTLDRTDPELVAPLQPARLSRQKGAPIRGAPVFR